MEKIEGRGKKEEKGRSRRKEGRGEKMDRSTKGRRENRVRGEQERGMNSEE